MAERKGLEGHMEEVIKYLTSTLKQARGNKARMLLLTSMYWLHELDAKYWLHELDVIAEMQAMLEEADRD